MKLVRRKTEGLYDIRVKYIGDQPVQLIYTPAPLFNPDNVVELDDYVESRMSGDPLPAPPSNKKGSTAGIISERGSARAKRAIADYIRCNPDMNWFITLTFDPDVLDRTDYNVIISKMNTWLGNRVRRHGLKYLLIPEFHKDGAVHFHGVTNNKLDTVFSGLYWRNNKVVPSRPGKKIYNIYDFDYGFNTVLKITGKNAVDVVANYIGKYITKDFRKVGGRYYLHGGDLAEPSYEFIRSSDVCSFADVMSIPVTAEYELYAGRALRICYGSDVLTFLGLLSQKAGERSES